MVIITYCLAVFLFCLAFYFTKLVTTCSEIIGITQRALATITDNSLDDAEKEKATKVAALTILKNSFLLVFKIVITFGATILPLLLADFTEIASFSETSKFALRIDVLLITTIVASVIVFLWQKLTTKQ